MQFVDSFDHYEIDDIIRKWTAEGFASIFANGRRGTNCFRTVGGSANASVVLPTPGTTMFVGVAVSRSTLITAATLISFMENSIVHVIIRAEPGGFVGAYRGTTSTLITGGFSTKSRMVQDQYCYVEAKVFVHDSTGTVEVRINGEVVLDLTSVDTRNGGVPTIDTIRLMGTADFDDLVIYDDQGSNNNDFLGDVEVEVILPDGAGNLTQWTTLVGAATHWQAVDESPVIDDDTSYVETATNTHIDLFTYGALSSINGGSTVLCVQANTMARIDSGSASIATKTRESSVTSTGATVVLGTGWKDVLQIWEVNPNGGGAWTDTILNASEFGFEKIA